MARLEARAMDRLLFEFLVGGAVVVGLRLTRFDFEAFDCTVHEGGHVDLGTFVVLASVEDPGQAGDDEDDGEGHDAVVHIVAGYGEFGWEDEENGCEDCPEHSHLEMLGLLDGEWGELTILHVQPSQLGSLNARSSGRILRPLAMMMAGGMP